MPRVVILIVLVFAAVARAADPYADKLAAVEKEIARLREVNARQRADVLAARLARVRDWIAGKPAAGNDDLPEVHVVGLYEGHNESAVIQVTAAERPLILVLCGYKPIRWDVRPAKGVRIERIILGGYYDQQLESTPGSAVVETYTNAAGHRGFFHCYEKESEAYAAAMRRINELAGPVATFQGVYQHQGAAIVIGDANAAWRQQRIEHEVGSLHAETTAHSRAVLRRELLKTRFTALHLRNISGLRFSASLGEFSAVGMFEETERQLPHGMKGAIRAGERVFGFDDGLVEIDLKTQTSKPIKFDETLPELDQPGALAFDSKRNRLVLASFGDVGHMYAFDLAKSQWSLLGEMDKVDLHALTYSAADDCFYGLARSVLTPVLLCYTPEGRRVRSVELASLYIDGRMLQPATPQLIAVGKQLALISAPLPATGGFVGGHPGEQRCYLLDPKSGAIDYHGEIRSRRASIKPATAEDLEAMWKRLYDANPASAEKALSDLAEHGDAVVALVRGQLPKYVPPDAARVRTLIAQLDSDDYKTRESSMRDLERIGPGFESELTATLAGDPSAEVRARLERIVKEIHARRAQAQNFSEMDRAMGDPDLRVRLRAVQLLTRIATPDAVDLLAEIATAAPGQLDGRQARLALIRM